MRHNCSSRSEAKIVPSNEGMSKARNRRARESGLLLLSALVVVAGSVLTGCTTASHPESPIDYVNAQYGLRFSLPADWQGYTVLTQQWEGISHLPSKDTSEVTTTGPVMVLRNPRWSADNFCQDIPILVFTHRQWEDETNGAFFPYAGGVIYELGHSHEYVFGIYSRYNADDSLREWREASGIVEKNLAFNKPQSEAPRP